MIAIEQEKHHRRWPPKSTTIGSENNVTYTAQLNPAFTQFIAVPGLLPENHDLHLKLDVIAADLKALRTNEAVESAQVHTVTEVAGILCCHRAQVFKLIKKGKLQTAPRVGRHTLILRASLLAFIDSVPLAAPRARAARARTWSPDGLDKLRI